MITPTSQIDKLTTERLLLIPFTTAICEGILNNDFSVISKIGLKGGQGWPDDDVLETLPKIINNLCSAGAPTGFESWMIVKKDTFEIIGDLGFKGIHHDSGNIDLGYGIIKEERKKGYALEAAKTLVNWAFTNEMVKEITAMCALDNDASVGLLRKLNFTETKKDTNMIYWAQRRA